MGSLNCPLCCKHMLPYLELKMHLTAYIKGPLECPVCMLSVVGIENLLGHLYEHDSCQEDLGVNVDVSTLILNGNLLPSCENIDVYNVSKLRQDELVQTGADQTVLHLEEDKEQQSLELYEASKNLLQLCSEDNNNLNSSLDKTELDPSLIGNDNCDDEFVVETDDVTNIINSDNVLLNPNMDEDSILKDLMYICVQCGVEYQSVELLQDHAKKIHSIDHMDLEVTPKITSQKTVKLLSGCPEDNPMNDSQTNEIINRALFPPFTSDTTLQSQKIISKVKKPYMSVEGNEMCNFSTLNVNEPESVTNLPAQKSKKSYMSVEETELGNYSALTINEPQLVSCLPAQKIISKGKKSYISLEGNEMCDYSTLTINEPEPVTCLPARKIMSKGKKSYDMTADETELVNYLALTLNEPELDTCLPAQKIISKGKKSYDMTAEEAELVDYLSLTINEPELVSCLPAQKIIPKGKKSYNMSVEETELCNYSALTINESELISHLPARKIMPKGKKTYDILPDEGEMCNSSALIIDESELANCLPAPIMSKGNKSCDITVGEKEISDNKPTEKIIFSKACEKCGRSFNRQDRYESHILIHMDRSLWPLECTICKQRYTTKHVLARHLRNIHQQRTPRVRVIRNGARTPAKDIICKQCGQGFSKTTYLRKHIYRCHKNEPVGTHKCKHCDKTFFSKPDLNEHVDRTHIKVKRCSCPICGKQCFNSGALKSHAKTHLEKPHACSYCDKRYAFKQDLRRHEQSHTGDKPHVCGTCGKRYRDVYFLNNHIRSHTGEKPYSCATCNMAFSTSKSLKNHVLIHADVKAFNCSYCTKTFRTHIQLYNHERIHTRPFKCHICEKNLESVTTLKKHILTHSEDYRCKICDQQFPNLRKYQKHEKKCCVTSSSQ